MNRIAKDGNGEGSGESSSTPPTEEFVALARGVGDVSLDSPQSDSPQSDGTCFYYYIIILPYYNLISVITIYIILIILLIDKNTKTSNFDTFIIKSTNVVSNLRCALQARIFNTKNNTISISHTKNINYVGPSELAIRATVGKDEGPPHDIHQSTSTSKRKSKFRGMAEGRAVDDYLGQLFSVFSIYLCDSSIKHIYIITHYKSLIICKYNYLSGKDRANCCSWESPPLERETEQIFLSCAQLTGQRGRFLAEQ